MATKEKKKIGEDLEIRNKGSYSAEIAQSFTTEQDNKTKMAEAQKKALKWLHEAKATEEILAGKVIGVQNDPDRKMTGVRVAYEHEVSPNHAGRVEVVIPDTAFFERKIESDSYNSKNEVAKYYSRKAFLTTYLGAIIHFCVVGVTYEANPDPSFEGEKLIYAVGNRNMAMAKLRDIYFFHKNRKRNDIPPREVKPDDKVEAFVVNTDNQMITVSALGVETQINLYNLATEPISSCKELVKNGDKITCYVKTLQVKDDNVHLVLSCRQTVTPTSIKYMKVGAIYLGSVIKYSPEKKVFTVMLANGVLASINENKIQGGIPLTLGDQVCVQIQQVFETHVMGSAYKL